MVCYFFLTFHIISRLFSNSPEFCLTFPIFLDLSQLYKLILLKWNFPINLNRKIIISTLYYLYIYINFSSYYFQGNKIILLSSGKIDNFSSWFVFSNKKCRDLQHVKKWCVESVFTYIESPGEWSVPGVSIAQ